MCERGDEFEGGFRKVGRMDLKQAMKENGFFLKAFYVVVIQHLTAYRPSVERGSQAEYKAIGSGGIGKAEMHALS